MTKAFLTVSINLKKIKLHSTVLKKGKKSTTNNI